MAKLFLVDQNPINNNGQSIDTFFFIKYAKKIGLLRNEVRKWLHPKPLRPHYVSLNIIVMIVSLPLLPNFSYLAESMSNILETGVEGKYNKGKPKNSQKKKIMKSKRDISLLPKMTLYLENKPRKKEKMANAIDRSHLNLLLLLLNFCYPCGRDVRRAGSTSQQEKHDIIVSSVDKRCEIN